MQKNIPGSEPEEHHRVQHVNLGDQDEGQHQEEKNVSQHKVGGEHVQLGDLAKELTGRLRDGAPAHRVPFTRPEGNVGLVRLDLASQAERDDQLEQESLDSNNGDHAAERLGKVEAFEDEHGQEEDQEHDDGDGVSDGSQNASELLAAHAEEGAHEAGHEEEDHQSTGVDGDGGKGHDAQAQ